MRWDNYTSVNTCKNPQVVSKSVSRLLFRFKSMIVVSIRIKVELDAKNQKSSQLSLFADKKGKRNHELW